MKTTRIAVVWFATMALLVAGWQAFAQDESGETPAAEESTEAAEPSESTEAAEPSDAPAENTMGAALYDRRCARCHGDTGQADTRMGERFSVRPWTAELLGELSEAGVTASVVEGRENMPAITELTDEELAALAAHVMTLGQ